MKSQDPTLFDEAGILITKTHLTVPGRTFAWRSLAFVRIVTCAGPLSRLLNKPQTYRLMVSTKTAPMLLSVFETQDTLLIGRLQQAINRIAFMLGAAH